MAIRRLAKNQWDRSAGIVCAGGGLLSIVFGYFGVARSTLATEQIPYLASGGLIGLFLLGVGATLWLSADLRDEWRKLEDIYQRMPAEDERDTVRENGTVTRPDGAAPAADPGPADVQRREPDRRRPIEATR